LEARVTAEFAETTLEAAAQSLAAAAKVRIVIAADRAHLKNEPVSLELTNLPLKDILTKILEPHGLAYRLRKDRIAIVRAKREPHIMGGPTVAEFSKTPLNDALETLSDLHSVDFVIAKRVDEKQSITYVANRVSLEHALAKMLWPRGLTYRVADDKIWIIENPLTPQKALEGQVSIEFVGTPLGDAMSFLTPFLKVDVAIAKGIDQDLPIHSTIRGIPASEAFTMLLKPRGLTYRIKNHTILILPVKPEPRARLEKQFGIAIPKLRLDEAMELVSESLNLEFTIADGVDRRLTVNSNSLDKPLKEALTEMLKSHDLAYEVDQDRIRIVRIEHKNNGK
jgi:hypothetical protein